MLPWEGGFPGTHLGLKSFVGLPQLISHHLVGVLCLVCSRNGEPALGCSRERSSAFSPFPSGPRRSKEGPYLLGFPEEPATCPYRNSGGAESQST